MALFADTGMRGSVRPGTAASHGRRAALALSAVVAGLMLTAAVTGLMVPAVYRDPPEMVSMLRGFDLVTAVLVVPVLIIALIGVRWGASLRPTVGGSATSTAGEASR